MQWNEQAQKTLKGEKIAVTCLMGDLEICIKGFRNVTIFWPGDSTSYNLY
jgi:hypothetical protein